MLFNPYLYGPRVGVDSELYVKRKADEDIPRIVAAHLRQRGEGGAAAAAMGGGFQGYWLAAPARSGKSSWLLRLRRDLKEAGAQIWEGVVDLEGGFPLRRSDGQASIDLPREDIEPEGPAWIGEAGDGPVKRRQAREWANSLLKDLGKEDVVLLDEAQYLALGGRFGGTGLAVGDLVTKSDGPVVVCVGQRSPELLGRREAQGQSEQFYNRLQRRELEHFTVEDIRSLVRLGFPQWGSIEPSGSTVPSHLTRVADQVLQMSGGYPELTQCLLGDLWDYLQVYPSTDADDLGRVLDEIGARRVADTTNPVFGRFTEFLKRTPGDERLVSLTLWGRLLQSVQASEGGTGNQHDAGTRGDGVISRGLIKVVFADDVGAQQLHAAGVARRVGRGERGTALCLTGTLFADRFTAAWVDIQIGEVNRPLAKELLQWLRLGRPEWPGDPSVLLAVVGQAENESAGRIGGARWGEHESAFISALKLKKAKIDASRQEEILAEVKKSVATIERWFVRFVSLAVLGIVAASFIAGWKVSQVLDQGNEAVRAGGEALGQARTAKDEALKGAKKAEEAAKQFGKENVVGEITGRVTESVKEKLEEATKSAESAKTTADTAKRDADAARTTAASAKANADAAQTTATAAKADAATAQKTATAAKADADAAQTTATVAKADADAAQTTATAAKADADAAQKTATAAKTTATAAKADADAAQKTATAAKTTATETSTQLNALTTFDPADNEREHADFKSQIQAIETKIGAQVPE